MYCLACDKKLRGIKEDADYNNWKRKYHKKCWNERNIYLDIIERCKKMNLPYDKYKKLACLM